MGEAVIICNIFTGRWFCPHHNCQNCSKRTCRSCYKCIKAFCPNHSEGNIRYDGTKFVCAEHDVKIETDTSSVETSVVKISADKLINKEQIIKADQKTEKKKVVKKKVKKQLKNKAVKHITGDENSETVQKPIKKNDKNKSLSAKKEKSPKKKNELPSCEVKISTTPIDEYEKAEIKTSSKESETNKIEGETCDEIKNISTKSTSKRKNTSDTKTPKKIAKIEEQELKQEVSDTNEDNTTSPKQLKTDLEEKLPEEINKNKIKDKKQESTKKLTSKKINTKAEKGTPKSASKKLNRSQLTSKIKKSLVDNQSEISNSSMNLTVLEDPQSTDICSSDSNLISEPSNLEPPLKKLKLDLKSLKKGRRKLSLRLNRAGNPEEKDNNVALVEPVLKLTQFQPEKYVSSDSEIESNIKFVQTHSEPEKKALFKFASSEDENSDNLEILGSQNSENVAKYDESSCEKDTNLTLVDNDFEEKKVQTPVTKKKIGVRRSTRKAKDNTSEEEQSTKLEQSDIKQAAIDESERIVEEIPPKLQVTENISSSKKKIPKKGKQNTAKMEVDKTSIKIESDSEVLEDKDTSQDEEVVEPKKVFKKRQKKRASKIELNKSLDVTSQSETFSKKLRSKSEPRIILTLTKKHSIKKDVGKKETDNISSTTANSDDSIPKIPIEIQPKTDSIAPDSTKDKEIIEKESSTEKSSDEDVSLSTIRSKIRANRKSDIAHEKPKSTEKTDTDVSCSSDKTEEKSGPPKENFKKRVLRSHIESSSEISTEEQITQIEEREEIDLEDKSADEPPLIKEETSLTEEEQKEKPSEANVAEDVLSANTETEEELSASNVDTTDASEDVPSETKKRKRGRPRKMSHAKNVKEKTESTKPEELFRPITEVKLTSVVPERHLRVTLRKTEFDSKNESKFKKMQADIEKDLPIRKRSKLRYETQV